VRQLTKFQLLGLWVCLAYFGVALLLIGSRAAFGFLRLGSEHPEAQVPRELLMSIADSAVGEFRLHALLVTIGFVMLGGLVLWLTSNRKT
jgi:hypothetical protein